MFTDRPRRKGYPSPLSWTFALAFRRDFGSTFGAPADDVLMFKIAYWFQR